MADLSSEELEKAFDFLELKRGEKLGCWLCGGNDWAARKVRRAERDDGGPEMWVMYVQLVCKNCKFVAEFTDKVLDGP